MQDASHFTQFGAVGKGGFGKVHVAMRRGPLAEQMERRTKRGKKDPIFYALKQMSKKKILESPVTLKMLWTERDILTKVHKLNSPFLLGIIHAFQNDRELFFVIPFLRGGDLRYQLEQMGHFDEPTCVFYTAKIVLGLEALHSLHIVYRDLKPENVLMDHQGNKNKRQKAGVQGRKA